MIAAVFKQVRKVRASQGRMPDNVRWRRLQGQCNRNIPPGEISYAMLSQISVKFDKVELREFAFGELLVRVERQRKRLPPAR